MRMRKANEIKQEKKSRRRRQTVRQQPLDGINLLTTQIFRWHRMVWCDVTWNHSTGKHEHSYTRHAGNLFIKMNDRKMYQRATSNNWESLKPYLQSYFGRHNIFVCYDHSLQICQYFGAWIWRRSISHDAIFVFFFAVNSHENMCIILRKKNALGPSKIMSLDSLWCMAREKFTETIKYLRASFFFSFLFSFSIIK